MIGKWRNTNIQDKILSLIETNPEPCSDAVKKMLASKEGINALSIVFGLIGFQYSRHLFDEIGPQHWKYLEDYFYVSSSFQESSQSSGSLAFVYKSLLAEIMIQETQSQKDDDVFSFLHQIDPSVLKWLLSQQASEKIALISVYWNEYRLSDILAQLDMAKKREVIHQINRIKRFPEKYAAQAADSFAEELLQIMATKSDSISTSAPTSTSRREHNDNHLSRHDGKVRAERHEALLTQESQALWESNKISVLSQLQIDELNLLNYLQNESPDVLNRLMNSDYGKHSPILFDRGRKPGPIGHT